MYVNAIPPFSTDSSRWLAVQTRNPRAEGTFVYCVRSTNVVCRPTCKARLPRRSNVSFCSTYAEAEAAGFRACKRCKPEINAGYDPQAVVVAQACRTIEQTGGHSPGGGTGRLPLRELAARAGLTKSHFHRVFKKVMGVTPKTYGEKLTAERIGELELVESMSTPGLLVDSHSVESSDGQFTSVTPYGRSNDGSDEGFQKAELDFLEDVGIGDDKVPNTKSYGSAASKSQIESRKEIEYTIQPWLSGFVLIAITKDGICWLEPGDSTSELARSLRSQFPFAHMKLSGWSMSLETKEDSAYKYAIFSAVMEALVKPSGKFLDIPFDVA